MEGRNQLHAPAILVDAAAKAGNRVASFDSNVRAANVPSATMTFGWMMSICRNRNGSHVATSIGSGLRLRGGRHLITFAM